MCRPETNLYFLLFIFAYVTPFPSLLVSQEFKTLFPYPNEKVETVGLDNAPLILLKFIHLALRIFINESLLKEKNFGNPFGKKEMGGGGAFLFKMTLGTAMLKL